MAGTCLICCVLIQVLHVTVSGRIKVNCPNQNGIEGKLIHLACTVECSNCNSTEDYNWIYSKGSPVKCTDLKTKKIDDNRHVFNCSIQNPLTDDSGEVTFWAQMTTGQNKKTFNVTIEPHSAKAALNGVVASHTAEPNGRSNIVFIAVLIVLLLVVSTMMVVFYRKKEKQHLQFITMDF